jgi:hypothetical protein
MTSSLVRPSMRPRSWVTTAPRCRNERRCPGPDRPLRFLSRAELALDLCGVGDGFPAGSAHRVVLFLPFLSNRRQQGAARAGTRRRCKTGRLYRSKRAIRQTPARGRKGEYKGDDVPVFSNEAGEALKRFRDINLHRHDLRHEYAGRARRSARPSVRDLLGHA